MIVKKAATVTVLLLVSRMLFEDVLPHKWLLFSIVTPMKESCNKHFRLSKGHLSLWWCCRRILSHFHKIQKFVKNKGKEG